jgi:hypothetical protein
VRAACAKDVSPAEARCVNFRLTDGDRRAWRCYARSVLIGNAGGRVPSGGQWRPTSGAEGGLGLSGSEANRCQHADKCRPAFKMSTVSPEWSDTGSNKKPRERR